LWHRDGVLWASFSPDGQHVVTSGEDFVAIVWDFIHGSQAGQPINHGNQVSTAIFNSDGKWIATSSGDHTARIWDAETQDSITPPLLHPWALTNVIFLPHDRAIATTDRFGDSFIWPIRLETRPLNDVRSLARLLASTHEILNLTSNDTPPRAIELLWNRLRARYPDDFSTTTNQIIAWHQQQILDSEKDENWAAAVFHLERKLLLRPGDEEVKDDLKRDRGLAAKARLH
jgi:WD40 repeat protein